MNADPIAIDGPSASGKSTAARRVARHLHCLYVDSGALYRALTWKVLHDGADPAVPDQVLEILRRTAIESRVVEGEIRFLLDGLDAGNEVRSPDVTSQVSLVAALPEVRAAVTARLRETIRHGRVAMDGRDIGTVVFPHTPLKFYLDASPEERARRRSAELTPAAPRPDHVRQVQSDLQARDTIDRTRKTAPLTSSPDALIIDTTHLTIDQVVDRILTRIGS